MDRQRNAVASWIQQGFEVLSVNCAQEIVVLEPVFPEAAFHPCTRDARPVCGKPLVPLDDLVTALRNEDRPLSGIVNSDIVLRAPGTAPLSEILEHSAGQGLTFAKRMDQEQPSSPGKRYDLGVDAFFFGRGLLAAYPSTPFYLGLPWWDYFYAAFPILAGFTTTEIREPVAFHLIHPSFFDIEKHWIPYAFETVRLLLPLLASQGPLLHASGMGQALRSIRNLSSRSTANGAAHTMEEAFTDFANAMLNLIEKGSKVHEAKEHPPAPCLPQPPR